MSGAACRADGLFGVPHNKWEIAYIALFLAVTSGSLADIHVQICRCLLLIFIFIGFAIFFLGLLVVPCYSGSSETPSCIADICGSCMDL